MTVQRILVLTLSFGSGHVRAAQVVADEIRVCEPMAKLRLTDALENSRALFRAFYVLPYWLMVRRAPRVWDWFFKHRVESRAGGTAPECVLRWGCAQVFDEIEAFKPDTIVACEVAACELATLAKREGLTNALVINVITDYEAEPIWVKREVDIFCVADERVREELIEWGAVRERISTCGIPIDPKFEKEASEIERQTTRAKFGIETDAPIVLLMGGGMGPTRMDEVAARLCRQNKTAMHVVAVAGHDKRALQRLEKLHRELLSQKTDASVSLHILGWTNEVAALMKVTSVLVTKPGGLSTTEAFACGLPCVLFDAIPGPEERNAARLVNAGAGVSTRGSVETAAAVLSLLCDEKMRERMAANAKMLARPRAAEKIARLVLSGKNMTDELPSKVERAAETLEIVTA